MISFLFPASIASAQYISQPTHAVEFRLFGRNAKPITENEREYWVTIRRIGTNAVESLLHYWGKDRLYYASAEWPIAPIPEIVITHGADTMTISGSFGIDSIGFEPGSFAITPPCSGGACRPIVRDRVPAAPKVRSKGATVTFARSTAPRT